MDPTIWATPRLLLKVATADSMALAADDHPDALGRSLKAHVPRDWPPLLDDN